MNKDEKQRLSEIREKLNSLDDFQTFIIENKIKSSSEFSDRFYGAYRKLRNLGLSEKVIYYGRNESIEQIKSKQIDLSVFTCVDDFQNFIIDHKIKSSSDFSDRFQQVYKKMRALKIYSENIIYFGVDVELLKKRKEYVKKVEELNSLDDFQGFIIDNKIKTSKEFVEKFELAYSKLLKLNLSNKIVYYGRKMSKQEIEFFVENLNNLEDFQKFINDRKINSAQELSEDYCPLYKKLTQLKLSRDVIYFGSQFSWNDLHKDLKSLEEFQELVNKYEIVDSSDFQKRFHYYYLSLRKLRLSEEIIYFNRETSVSQLKELINKTNSLEEFQTYIIDNKIASSHDFRGHNKNLFEKMQSLGYSEKIIYYNKQKPYQRNPEIDKYNSLEDFQELVNLKKFENPNALRKYNERIYRKMLRLGYQTKIKYFGSYFRHWTIEDYQSFIDTNEVQNSTDLKTRFPGVFNKIVSNKDISSNIHYPNPLRPYSTSKIPQETALKTILDRCKELDYTFVNKDSWVYDGVESKNIELRCNKHGRTWITNYVEFITKKRLIRCCRQGSKLEKEVIDLLNSKGINIEIQKRFDFLGKKVIDVYLLDYNLAIECQGDQHFTPIKFFGGIKNFKKQQKRDRQKFKECLENNIEILYYVNEDYIGKRNREKVLSKVNNYLSKVYLNLDDLWNRISEIITEKESILYI